MSQLLKKTMILAQILSDFNLNRVTFRVLVATLYKFLKNKKKYNSHFLNNKDGRIVLIMRKILDQDNIYLI
jgi:hypothetical protein